MAWASGMPSAPSPLGRDAVHRRRIGRDLPPGSMRPDQLRTTTPSTTETNA